LSHQQRHHITFRLPGVDRACGERCVHRSNPDPLLADGRTQYRLPGSDLTTATAAAGNQLANTLTSLDQRRTSDLAPQTQSP